MKKKTILLVNCCDVAASLFPIFLLLGKKSIAAVNNEAYEILVVVVGVVYIIVLNVLFNKIRMNLKNKL